ncbi:uncharacterized protein LOC143835620 isoform X2 [Paroedura picta]|uniref:uncharacterized protein LOC143835620 isoform X2 n=1 Tax=Paroedura picta TaxID=143630 RepID=UPI0040565D52
MWPGPFSFYGICRHSIFLISSSDEVLCDSQEDPYLGGLKVLRPFRDKWTSRPRPSGDWKLEDQVATGSQVSSPYIRYCSSRGPDFRTSWKMPSDLTVSLPPGCPSDKQSLHARSIFHSTCGGGEVRNGGREE